jgi:ATP-dependent Clp protease ATP-binding subunit ClpA
MARLIQDTIRKALADELLFGRLVGGGKVNVDVDEAGQITLDFSKEPSGDAPPAPQDETVLSE